LDAVGINRDEAEYLKKNDILRAVEGLNTHLPWWANLDVVRQRALVELAFNMGIGSSSRGLLSFRNALPALQRGDYEAAAAGFRNSKWAKDVGPRRTKRITNMLQFGDAMSESSESATS
jgi:lysozyme